MITLPSRLFVPKQAVVKNPSINERDVYLTRKRKTKKGEPEKRNTSTQVKIASSVGKRENKCRVSIDVMGRRAAVGSRLLSTQYSVQTLSRLGSVCACVCVRAVCLVCVPKQGKRLTKKDGTCGASNDSKRIQQCNRL